MKRILLTLAIMLCSVQMVFAYSISGSGGRCKAEVSTAGQITDLVVDGMVAPLSGIIEAAIGYGSTGGQWVSGFPLLGYSVETTSSSVSAIYKKNNVLAAGDSLIVRVKSKIVGDNPYIDQRYEVTYWEGAAGPLTNVKAYLYVQTHVPGHVEMLLPIGALPLTSAWGASDWPNPVETDVAGNLRVCAYVPGQLDDNQTGDSATIRAAIEAGVLNPALNAVGGAVGMSWNLGTIGNAPALAHNALDVRATVVPEPCTMALIGTGLLGLFGMRRRKA